MRYEKKPVNNLASICCLGEIPTRVPNMLENSKSKQITRFWVFLGCVGHSTAHHKNRFERFTYLILQLLKRMSENFVAHCTTFAYSLQHIWRNLIPREVLISVSESSNVCLSHRSRVLVFGWEMKTLATCLGGDVVVYIAKSLKEAKRRRGGDSIVSYYYIYYFWLLTGCPAKRACIFQDVSCITF